MAVRIAEVHSQSAASKAGLSRGDWILEIDGQEVLDSIDFMYLASEPVLEMLVRSARTGQIRHLCLEAEEGFGLGIEVAPDPVRRCRNHCVFCFIDQNPKGLRKRLYVKDEDYRLSFLHGNYVTPTGLRETDLERIEKLRLSPLYLSVHAVQPEIYARMVRPRTRGSSKRGSASSGAACSGPLPVLERLAGSGIQMHLQIVLVPGYNDAALPATLETLLGLGRGVLSIAVVPVGLTGHREGLEPLRPVSQALAQWAVDLIGRLGKRSIGRTGRRIVFASDELYLQAGMDLPPAEYYEDFPQIENGVGMVRQMEARFEEMDGLLPSGVERRRVALITGELFAPFLLRFATRLLQRGCGKHALQVLGISNRLFGGWVSVAGLLGGQELAEAASEAEADLAVLPPEAFNEDGLTLDGMSVAEIERRAGKPVRVASLGRWLIEVDQ